MRHSSILKFALAALFLIPAGCAHKSQPVSTDAPYFTWIQTTDPSKPMTGKASFWPEEDGVKIRVVVTGAPRGMHGMHIHENGSCAELGNAAGSHFNPDNVKHGEIATDGMQKAHPGDLGNLNVEYSGFGTKELFVPHLTFDRGHFGIAGRAIVIHEKADDYGQPTGNAGGRIACAVIPNLPEPKKVEPAPVVAPVVTTSAVPAVKAKRKRSPWLLWLY